MFEKQKERKRKSTQIQQAGVLHITRHRHMPELWAGAQPLSNCELSNSLTNTCVTIEICILTEISEKSANDDNHSNNIERSKTKKSLENRSHANTYIYSHHRSLTATQSQNRLNTASSVQSNRKSLDEIAVIVVAAALFFFFLFVVFFCLLCVTLYKTRVWNDDSDDND